MPEREYIIFCDESAKAGPHYSNFYGGVMVGASTYQATSARLQMAKADQNLRAEAKWQKVTDQYLDKYKALMAAFFEEMHQGHAKVRIMFRQTAITPIGLTANQQRAEYYMLYYQFIKHAFGLRYIPPRKEGTHLRLYFDQFPDTGEQVEQFKGYLKALEKNKDLRARNIRLRAEDITEVRSHEHVLLQCLDVVVGAMNFRLNDMHRAKPIGKACRGRRTIAKEKLYKHIRKLICRVREQRHFNIGISTGQNRGPQSRWLDAYRHWSFVPKDHEFDERKTKGWKKRNPT